jgi:hydrogenase-4 component E
MRLFYHSFLQLDAIIPSLLLLTSFIFLMQKRIHSMINTFIAQSALIVATTFIHAINTSQTDLFISASLTLVLKVLFIPYLLRFLVKKLNIRHKVTDIAHPFLLLIGSAVLVLFCYYLIAPLSDSFKFVNGNIIAIAMAVTLLGMLLLITHRKAISHVIGFMAMENGIFFAALVATHGMPMVVELGVAFDVLIAFILFGVFFFHLRSSIDSLDVDRLILLRGDVDGD